MPGQTKAEIRALLNEYGLTPQHRFGQNFLIDLNLLRKVVTTAEVGPADVVLEVGPGTGSLTECLLEAAGRVVAVEIDRGFQKLLTQRFATDTRFTLICGDALAGKHRLNPEILAALDAQPPAPGGCEKLVANLPYQIATPLLIELMLSRPSLARLTCTVQLEVGEKLAAAAGEDAYGALSVLVETVAEAALALRLPPGAFWPAPQVDSVLLDLRRRATPLVAAAELRDFAAFVRGAFSQRRKTLRRISRDWPLDCGAAALARAEIDPQLRPENLTPTQWRRVFAAVGACSSAAFP